MLVRITDIGGVQARGGRAGRCQSPKLEVSEFLVLSNMASDSEVQESRRELDKIAKREEEWSPLDSPVLQYRLKMRRHIRRVLTGDGSVRVRDLLQDKVAEPKIGRQIDNVAFTLNLISLCITEAVLLCYPDKFWMWYFFFVPIVIGGRYPYYKSMQWVYYMIDFCYFAHLYIMLQSFISPASCLGHKISFLFANGPLIWAVPCWRNSLVLHDMEKTSSVYIHAFPSLLSLATTWHSASPVYGCPSIDRMDVGWSLGIYCIWQVIYYIKTEVVDREILEKSPQFQTSLRFLSSDTRHVLNKAVLNLTRKWGVMGAEEVFDPSTFKTKFVFMLSQFVYTAIVMLPVPLLYKSFYAHAGVVAFAFIIAIWNGGNFYTEVFSRRYWADWEKRGEQREQKLRRKFQELILDDGYANGTQNHTGENDKTVATIMDITTSATELTQEEGTIKGMDNVELIDNRGMDVAEMDNRLKEE